MAYNIFASPTTFAIFTLVDSGDRLVFHRLLSLLFSLNADNTHDYFRETNTKL